MTPKVKYMVVVLVLVSFALMAIPAFAGKEGCSKAYGTAGEVKGVSLDPVSETIEKTDSIRQMRSQPARGLAYTCDALGNKVPTQTCDSDQR